jgi:dTDP-D-glucose 4,6-dehydratase
MAGKLMIVHMPMLPSRRQPILEIAVPELRELVEMRLQTDRSYSVDAGKFRARFGQEATSFEDGLDATARIYRNAARGPAGKTSR